MATYKLTKKLIDGFSYEGDGKQKDIRWDTEMRGFGVRVYPSGQRAFVLSYRQDGTKRLFTVGQYGNITLEQAREIGRKRFGEVADGKDPTQIRKARKKKHEWTVKKAFDDFLKKYAQERNKRWKETERIFVKDVLPILGHKPLDEVKRDDLVKLLDGIVDRDAGIMANRTLAAMRRFFNWCIQRSLIEHSPAFMISMPAKAASRDRVLYDGEIQEIWQASESFNYPFGPLVRFLLLTGQRRGEVAEMEWDEVDLKKKLWVIPREKTKTDRRQEVPLSNMAVEILQSIPKLGPYMFTSAGPRPFENFSRDKEDLDKRINARRKENKSINMPGWVLHDLRRTVASGLASLEIPPHIIEAILNHSSGTISGVAAVYNRHDYAGPKRKALEAWADHLEKVLKAPPSKSCVGRI